MKSDQFTPFSGFNVDCEKCYITMGKIPGEDINYSDHEGVSAEFRIQKNLTGKHFVILTQYHILLQII